MPKGIYQHKSVQGFQKGHGFLGNQETKRKLSNSLMGHRGYWSGKKRPEEQVLNGIKKRSGENHYNWKGGISQIKKTERQLLMQTREYKLWRKTVFERDNYTCIFCKKTNVILNADHIKSWNKHVKLRFSIENGRTLCLSCHGWLTGMEVKLWRSKVPELSFV